MVEVDGESVVDATVVEYSAVVEGARVVEDVVMIDVREEAVVVGTMDVVDTIVGGADIVDATDVAVTTDVTDIIGGVDVELPLFSVTTALVVEPGIITVELTGGVDADAMGLGGWETADVDIITGVVDGGAETDPELAEDVNV